MTALRTTGRRARAALALALVAAGCNGSPPAIPTAEAGGDYGAPPLKDDAQANARVAPGGFPLSFVDCNGNAVDLTRYRGKSKVVLVVLRGLPREFGGEFCPSCLAQVGSLTANRAEFARRGAEVLTLFPGPTDRLGEFFKRVKLQTPGEPEAAFPVLVDREGEAVERLGIRDDLAKPSTYVLDTKGDVVYAYVGRTSTDRPSVSAILAQLDRAD